MTPAERVHGLATGATIAAAVVVFKHAPKALQSIPVEVDWLLAFVTGVGFYKLTNELLIFVILRVRFLKKRMLGERWVEGTWVGCYKGTNGDWRRVIERFRQDMSTVRLTFAQASDASGPRRAWYGVSSHLDDDNKRLSYSYQTQCMGSEGARRGIGEYSLRLEGGFPAVLEGHSTDVEDGSTTRVVEVRVSDDPDFATELSQNEVDKACERAKLLY